MHVDVNELVRPKERISFKAVPFLKRGYPSTLVSTYRFLLLFGINKYDKSCIVLPTPFCDFGHIFPLSF
jgi:hypothetical protein